ncbi:hypothetical protein ID866_1060 [Astraeus odoratus]|nr:hypothetical protein ID866_1060 [Astraeus odoratus]
MSGDDDSSGWQLTESDPGVFTELLKTLGVPYIVDDLYSLDPEALSVLKPIHALIFLFKWLPSTNDEPSSQAGEYDRDFPGFFAHQTVNNACATLATINALGNIPSLTSGPQLADLLAFTADMDAEMRGMVVTSADWLREAHNALSPPNAISLDGLGLPNKTEDAYHFVVYLPVAGNVYELDGLKRFPIEFSLLAIRDDPLPAMNSHLELLRQSGRDAEARELLIRISRENSKREQWAFENSLRRHNHIGLAHALLVALAKAGRLQPAVDTARGLMRERIERRREMGLTDMDDD